MENTVIHSYKDLVVWQKSKQLAVLIYKITEKFPKEEIYGLTSQMRRSAVSIPSNIAEGRFRGSANEFLQFLKIAYGSGAELETQIEIAKELPATKNIDYNEAIDLLTEVMKMLNVVIRKFEAKKLSKLKPN